MQQYVLLESAGFDSVREWQSVCQDRFTKREMNKIKIYYTYACTACAFRQEPEVCAGMVVTIDLVVGLERVRSYAHTTIIEKKQYIDS